MGRTFDGGHASSATSATGPLVKIAVLRDAPLLQAFAERWPNICRSVGKS
jgi:hypothetical protein